MDTNLSIRCSTLLNPKENQRWRFWRNKTPPRYSERSPLPGPFQAMSKSCFCRSRHNLFRPQPCSFPKKRDSNCGWMPLALLPHRSCLWPRKRRPTQGCAKNEGSFLKFVSRAFLFFSFFHASLRFPFFSRSAAIHLAVEEVLRPESQSQRKALAARRNVQRPPAASPESQALYRAVKTHVASAQHRLPVLSRQVGTQMIISMISIISIYARIFISFMST